MAKSLTSPADDDSSYTNRRKRKFTQVPPWPQLDRIDDEPASSATPLQEGTPRYFRGDPHPTKPGFRFLRWHNAVAVWGDTARWKDTKRHAMLYRRKKFTHGDAFVARILWAAARRRAKHYGVPFTITIEDVIEMLRDAGPFCPALKIPFHGQGRYEKGGSPGSRSLHRVHADLGYQRFNLRVISRRANWLICLYRNGAEAHSLGNFVDRTNAEVAHHLSGSPATIQHQINAEHPI